MQTISSFVWVLFIVVLGFITYSAMMIAKDSEGSFKAFGLFYPAMGGLLVSCYYLFKDYYPLYTRENFENKRVEFAMLYKDRVMPLSLINRTSFDDWGKELSAYRIGDFNQLYIRDFFTKPVGENRLLIEKEPFNEDYIDILDFTILEYLTIYFAYNPPSVSTNVVKASTVRSFNKDIMFLKVTKEDLMRVKTLHGHSTRNPETPYFEAITDWKIPEGTNYRKEEKEKRLFRSHIFENKKWEFIIHITGFGGGHFDPQNFKFHNFLRGTAIDAISANTALKTFTMNISFRKKMKYSLSDKFDQEVEYMKNLAENFEKDFSWDLLKLKIKDEYLSQSI